MQRLPVRLRRLLNKYCPEVDTEKLYPQEAIKLLSIRVHKAQQRIELAERLDEIDTRGLKAGVFVRHRVRNGRQYIETIIEIAGITSDNYVTLRGMSGSFSPRQFTVVD